MWEIANVPARLPRRHDPGAIWADANELAGVVLGKRGAEADPLACWTLTEALVAFAKRHGAKVPGFRGEHDG